MTVGESVGEMLAVHVLRCDEAGHGREPHPQCTVHLQRPGGLWCHRGIRGVTRRAESEK